MRKGVYSSFILLIEMVGELCDPYRLLGYSRPEREKFNGVFSLRIGFLAYRILSQDIVFNL